MPYYKGRPAFVVGRDVQSPLTPLQRFLVGRLAVGLRLGVAPFLRRDPASAATALYGAAAAAESTLAAGEGRAGMAETTRRIYKAMPRRVRKAVPDAARGLGDGRIIDAWAQLVHRSANRAGLLLSGDLAAVLAALIGETPTPEIVLASIEGRDMLTFWLSPEALALRQKLGLST